jgi:flagellin-like hook-associated protein FlgL
MGDGAVLDRHRLIHDDRPSTRVNNDPGDVACCSDLERFESGKKSNSAPWIGGRAHIHRPAIHWDCSIWTKSEIDRIADNTQWNGMNLLDGTGGNWGGGSLFTFQVGANAGQTISVAIAGMGIASLGISAVSIGTVADARDAVTALDDAISVLNTRRSVIGSVINRLTHAVDNLTNVSQNATESRSRVTDTDYATATSELARTQIVQQAATAILAQANQQPQMVLSLLK